jgi:hypothetical protein
VLEDPLVGRRAASTIAVEVRGRDRSTSAPCRRCTAIRKLEADRFGTEANPLVVGVRRYGAGGGGGQSPLVIVVCPLTSIVLRKPESGRTVGYTLSSIVADPSAVRLAKFWRSNDLAVVELLHHPRTTGVGRRIGDK